MLSAIIYLILITSVAGAIAVGFNIRIGHTFLPAICATGLGASVMLVFGVTQAVPIVFGVVGLLCLVFIAFRIFQEKKRAFYILTTEFVIFAALAVGMILLNAGRCYILDDEFSHWGLAVKNLFTVGKLPFSVETNAIFRAYPPFATAICYLGTCFTGSFSEGATFVPVDMLLIAALLPMVTGFLRQCGKKGCAVAARCFAAVPAAAMFFCILCFKLSAFSSIAVDTLIGVMTFYVVWECVQARRNIQIICALVAALALTLVKETGLAFALFAVIIVFSAITAKNLKKKNKKGIAADAAAQVLPLVLGSVIAKLFWNYIVLYANAKTDGEGILGGLFKAMGSGFTEVQKTTAAAFFRAFLKPTISFGIPLAAVIVVFAAVQIVTAVLLKKVGFDDTGTITAVFIAASACFLLYCGGILASYLTVFTPGEATAVASFERYIGTYLTFWLSLIVAVIVTVLPGALMKRLGGKFKSPKTLPAVLGVISTVVAAAGIIFFAASYPYTAKASAEKRTLENYGSDIPSLCEQEGVNYKDRILFVASDFKTRMHLIANYNAAPYIVDGLYNLEEALDGKHAKYVYFNDIGNAELIKEVAAHLEDAPDPSVIVPHKLYKIKTA